MDIRIVEDRINDLNLKIAQEKMGNPKSVKAKLLTAERDILMKARREALAQADKKAEMRDIERRARKEAVKEMKERYGITDDINHSVN